MAKNNEPITLAFNGINAGSGEYVIPEMSIEDFLRRTLEGKGNLKTNAAHLGELKAKQHRQSSRAYDVMAGIDKGSLAESGWGIIFWHDCDQAIRNALTVLVEQRKNQATQIQEGRFQELSGYKGLRPSETKQEFLARHGVAAGMPADPDVMPYYLLLVGPPTQISFQFQYELDVEYAVGRVCFDTAQEYERYARSVVEFETRQLSRPKSSVFFGVHNEGDEATRRSTEYLIPPVVSELRTKPGAADWNLFEVTKETTKDSLMDYLGGGKTPSLLFTASHGAVFDAGHNLQRRHQGALVCKNWPGPKWKGPLPTDHYVSADDIGDDASVFGMIAFHFACYGAGTPDKDNFGHAVFPTIPTNLANEPFVARLPQRLLGHPKGGALAVVGHVDKAWDFSFYMAPQQKPQLQTFRSCLHEMLVEGRPIGAAMESFGQRYAALATILTAVLENIQLGKKIEDFSYEEQQSLVMNWLRHNDARNYTVVGDPAVRLGTGKTPSADLVLDRAAVDSAGDELDQNYESSDSLE